MFNPSKITSEFAKSEKENIEKEINKQNRYSEYLKYLFKNSSDYVAYKVMMHNLDLNYF